MIIDEMHIKVRQDLQKIDSHANGNLLDGEIDFHLNYFTDKFVDNVMGDLKKSPVTSADFQHNQRMLDMLRTIHVKNYRLTAKINPDEDDTVYVTLPKDYNHLVNDASELYYNCSGVTKNGIDSRRYIAFLPFLAENDTFPTLEIKKVLENGSIETMFNLSDYSSQYPNGIADSEQKFELINLILSKIPNIYWEYFDGKYYPNKFVLDMEVPHNTAVKLTNFDRVDVTDPEFNELVYNYYENFSKIYRFTTTEKTVRRPNRLNKDVNIDFVRNHPFEKTTWEFPISTIAGDKLFIYEDSEFKVKNVIIDYIKKPARVSKLLGIHSDLTEGAQKQILEQTIIHLKGIIQDPSWQTAMQHNQLNNQ